MRYTLRLLTLDQLARAAGVVCALELMRDRPEQRRRDGRRLLGDWPIEIGLWVGSDASPNRLGGKGDADETTAVGRVRRYQNGQDKRAPAPLKACPWCGTPFTPRVLRLHAERRMRRRTSRSAAPTPAATSRGNRPLPILTVDEPIYRRLPAFLIATVDKFASLPWVGETGAFFGHVDRFDDGIGFYGAAEPGQGRPLDNGWSLDPPDLIIQDELHLIAGPLGTVAGLYEAAIDQLAIAQGRRASACGRRSSPRRRRSGARPSRSRRCSTGRDTSIFPPPGIDRTRQLLRQHRAVVEDPARLYLGIAAQGRGPKLVFLRALTTLLAAAQAAYDATPAAASRRIRPIPT